MLLNFFHSPERASLLVENRQPDGDVHCALRCLRRSAVRPTSSSCGLREDGAGLVMVDEPELLLRKGGRAAMDRGLAPQRAVASRQRTAIPARLGHWDGRIVEKQSAV